MGSPVSITVTNHVMENVEDRALSLPTVWPPFWMQYVDNMCTALDPKDIEVFSNILNPSIKFTLEREKLSASFFGH